MRLAPCTMYLRALGPVPCTMYTVPCTMRLAPCTMYLRALGPGGQLHTRRAFIAPSHASGLHRAFTRVRPSSRLHTRQAFITPPALHTLSGLVVGGAIGAVMVPCTMCPVPYTLYPGLVIGGAIGAVMVPSVKNDNGNASVVSSMQQAASSK